MEVAVPLELREPKTRQVEPGLSHRSTQGIVGHASMLNPKGRTRRRVPAVAHARPCCLFRLGVLEGLAPPLPAQLGLRHQEGRGGRGDLELRHGLGGGHPSLPRTHELLERSTALLSSLLPAGHHILRRFLSAPLVPDCEPLVQLLLGDRRCLGLLLRRQLCDAQPPAVSPRPAPAILLFFMVQGKSPSMYIPTLPFTLIAQARPPLALRLVLQGRQRGRGKSAQSSPAIFLPRLAPPSATFELRGCGVQILRFAVCDM
eukprot:762509-Hanusia_phi.AAC.10